MTQGGDPDELYFDSQDTCLSEQQSEGEECWHDAWEAWELDDGIQDAGCRPGTLPERV